MGLRDWYNILCDGDMDCQSTYYSTSSSSKNFTRRKNVSFSDSTHIYIGHSINID